MNTMVKELIDTGRRWLARLDREQAVAFGRFLWHRFLDENCFESAGALAYTTMFALVPFAAVVFVVLSAFPVFDEWTTRLLDFVFSNFVPESARVIEQYLRDFAASARELSTTGVIALLVSVLLTMWSIEQAFNRIWRVPAPRPKLMRFLVYWTLLTLGSLIMVAAMATTSALFSLPALSGAETRGVTDRLLLYLPTLLEFVAFTLAYWLVPHRPVPLRFAVAGGLLAMLLFELLQWAFAIYLRNASFNQLYGAMAVLPIFLIWLYLSWLVVLLGASLAASLSAFRYQPRALRLAPGTELYGLMRLLGQLQQVRHDGGELSLEDIRLREASLTDDLLQRMLSSLSELHIVRQSEQGGWLLARDLDDVPLAEIYEGMALRVPAVDLPLPARHDALGRAAAQALEHLRHPLSESLQRSVGSFLKPKEPEKPVE
jgi:membrane protein